MLSVLDLERVDDDTYVGLSPDLPRDRVFGGQVVAQSARAAAHTVDASRRLHSLHAYFIRPGDYREPIRLEVDRIRDGRSFVTRRVVARQRGEAILSLSASFHDREPGHEFQVDPPPDLPDPESLPQSEWGSGLVDLRPFGADADDPHAWRTRVLWFRVPEPFPEEPVLHACAIAYASDHGLMGAIRSAHEGLDTEQMMSASLDHAMWLHREARADDWLLYRMDPQSASGGRGLARGSIHDRDGMLVASATQEALMRPRR